MLTPGESQHLIYAIPNGSPFLFRRFVSNFLYFRRVQIVAQLSFLVKNTFTMEGIISADMSRRTAKNNWAFV
jgi:hypothetical protein